MSQAQELLTPRLRLRRWRIGDEPLMAAINDDPEVTRFLNRPVGATATAAFFAGVEAHWTTHGFGPWALETRTLEAPGRFIGFVGVGYPTFLAEVAARPELGWRLARATWGRGLATEAATVARDHAWKTLGCDELISIIHPDNTRSQSIAIKLGMTVERQIHNPVLDRSVEVWQCGAPQPPDARRRRVRPARSA